MDTFAIVAAGPVQESEEPQRFSEFTPNVLSRTSFHNYPVLTFPSGRVGRTKNARQPPLPGIQEDLEMRADRATRGRYFIVLGLMRCT